VEGVVQVGLDLQDAEVEVLDDVGDLLLRDEAVDFNLLVHLGELPLRIDDDLLQSVLLVVLRAADFVHLGVAHPNA